MTATAPPDRLDALVARVTERLEAAVGDRRAAWRTPMLATLAEGGAPTLRTVVMRAFDPASRRIRINTDRRSAKAAQIAGSPRVELGFWDPDSGEQLRVAGVATVSTSAEAIAQAWQALTPEGKKVYRGPAAPGTPVVAPDAPDDGEAAAGPHALMVVTVAWDRLDWLWLGRDGHRRAVVVWPPGGGFEATLVVP